MGGNVIALNDGETENKLKINGIFYVENVFDVVNILNNTVMLKRDVILFPESKDIRVSHVLKEGIHFYLIVNEGEEAFKGRIRLKALGKPEKWDAVEGKTYRIDKYAVSDGYIEFHVILERRESSIICINASTMGKVANDPDLEFALGEEDRVRETEVINLANGWEIRNSPVAIEMDKTLETWTEWKGMEDYSGTISYYNMFTIVDDVSSFASVKADLGRVCEIAQLFINGREAGVRLWGPFVFDIKEFVQQGINTIEIKVTNSLANRINKAKLDSGLLGPCKVVLEKINNG